MDARHIDVSLRRLYSSGLGFDHPRPRAVEGKGRKKGDGKVYSDWGDNFSVSSATASPTRRPAASKSVMCQSSFSVAKRPQNPRAQHLASYAREEEEEACSSDSAAPGNGTAIFVFNPFSNVS